jgi:hypothetical protein
MLNVVSMVTTKKVVIDYKHKETRREFNISPHTQKNQLNTKEIMHKMRRKTLLSIHKTTKY